MKNEKNKLTIKQEGFARDIAVSGMSQSDAYRNNYNCKKMTNKSIWERASALAADSKVAPRIAELRLQDENKFFWAKEEMLKDLMKIKDEAIEEMWAVDKNGKGTMNVQARNTAIKAIERAAKMLGYDAPQKVEMEANVRIEDYVKKAESENDY